MIVNGWFDWADRSVPGPANKVYVGSNALEGIACHSAEGFLEALLRQIQDPSSGNSWHGTIPLKENFYQHYPIQACCWTSGNRTANIRLIAFESEGLADKPLNPHQRAIFKRIVRDLEEFTGKEMSRSAGTLWNHNEVWNWGSPNSGPTACPSGRYDQVFQEIEGEDEMTPEEKAMLNEVYARTGGLPGQGIDLLASVNNLNDAMHDHINIDHEEDGVDIGDTLIVKVVGVEDSE